MDLDVRLIAPLATTIGIFVSVYLWVLNQKRKRLSYRVLSCGPILKVKGSSRKHLSVAFDGTSVDDACLIVVRLTNSGHLPITAGDYTTDLSINFNPGSRVLMADVALSSPADLDDRVRQSDSNLGLIKNLEATRVVLRPVLMNDGDSVTYQIVVRNHRGGLNVRGHINGVSSVVEERKKPIVPRLLSGAGLLTILVSLLICEPTGFFTWGLEEILPCMQLFALGCMLLWFGQKWPKPLEVML
jgi:hypothetical protein